MEIKTTADLFTTACYAVFLEANPYMPNTKETENVYRSLVCELQSFGFTPLNVYRFLCDGVVAG